MLGNSVSGAAGSPQGDNGVFSPPRHDTSQYRYSVQCVMCTVHNRVGEVNVMGLLM